MDDDDTEVIDLLDDQFMDALLGAVYDDNGTPVPCYSSAMVMDMLLMDGHDEASARASAIGRRSSCSQQELTQSKAGPVRIDQ